MKLPPLSLYIHLPWCEHKCPYCDFNSHEAGQIPEGRYVDALLEDLRADLALVQGRTIETLFIGGGTPSLFSAGSIARLMAGIAATTELGPGLEASMEANPGSAEAEKFSGFAEAGINRLSLGIQSFQDRQLQALGRIHNSDEAHAAIHMARTAGFSNFNIDLMHGLPGQGPVQASEDLQTALGYAPAHLSWYQLTIEPNTAFYKHPPELPLEDNLADIQQLGEKHLSAATYRQYEVSTYALPDHRCRHNLNYWSFGDYLGIGAGAHSKISFPDGQIWRYSKRRQPERYLACSQFIASQRQLQCDDISGEFMLNALRLHEGFPLSLFSERTGLTTGSIEQALASLEHRELLQITDGWVNTTDLGRRFLDTVIAEFF